MHLEVITPTAKIYDGEVTRVRVPGTKGSFEILNNHAAVISTLENGKVRITDAKNNQQFLQIKGGLIEVLKNNITLLTESAEGNLPEEEE